MRQVADVFRRMKEQDEHHNNSKLAEKKTF